ncbi:MAG: SDR family oxidoreductase [Caulobacter sp.]|nr:SDR family oxidoreductase [Caulobacter sp.]
MKALVVGGGDSVGRAIAEAMLGRGDEVHIVDLRPDAVAGTLAANPSLSGSVADFGDPRAIDRALDEAFTALGGINALVYTVGLPGPVAAIEDIDLAEWDQCWAVNVTGLLRAIQLVTPRMKAQGGGSIVAFSTSSTRTRLPRRTPYVVTKFALEGLVLNAARELGPAGIRVNAIQPGMIDNARMRGIVERKAAEEGVTPDEIEAGFTRFISLRSSVSLDDLAQSVLFLTSPAAARVTGELLAVSGNAEWEA